MPPEPAIKRAVAFVDGQNLFFAARQAFGYTYPTYDFPAPANTVCSANGWQLEQAMSRSLSATPCASAETADALESSAPPSVTADSRSIFGWAEVRRRLAAR
jgi:hypothetical protein